MTDSTERRRSALTRPKPSLCLHLPKTGTTYTARFFAAADWLHLRRACGLRRLRLPARMEIRAVEALKRIGLRYGNVNAALRDRHARYSALPARLRGYPRLCTLRGVAGWHVSQYIYYTRAMTSTMLDAAIRWLVDGGLAPRDPVLRAVLRRRRREFCARWYAEREVPGASGRVPVAFFAWFNRRVRAECLLRRWTGRDIFPAPAGFLTVRTVGLLFEDAATVLSLPEPELEAYFKSGRHRRNLRCDHFLRFERLTGDLGALMRGALGYDPDIVDFLARRLGPANVSPPERRRKVHAAFEAGGLLERIRHSEHLYERYLLPLAGGAAPGDPA